MSGILIGFIILQNPLAGGSSRLGNSLGMRAL